MSLHLLVVLVLVLDQQLVLLVMDSPSFTSRGQVLALYLHQALQVLLLYSSKVVVVKQVLLEHGQHRVRLVFTPLNLWVSILTQLTIQIYKVAHMLVLLDHSKVSTLVMV